jgi:hypothetical protein
VVAYRRSTSRNQKTPLTELSKMDVPDDRRCLTYLPSPECFVLQAGFGARQVVSLLMRASFDFIKICNHCRILFWTDAAIQGP